MQRPHPARDAGGRRWWRWLRDIGLFVLVFVVIQWWQSRDLVEGPAPPLVGHLLDGSPYQLAATQRPVLVHFWATWCPVCRLEQDSIASIAADWPTITIATTSGSAEEVSGYLLEDGLTMPVLLDENDTQGRGRHFVNCGIPLPNFEVQIRDDDKVLGDWQSGVIYLRGPSVMSGYANHPEITSQVLSDDGWLNTGDIGYRAGDSLYITGRAKDLLIINGRNIWPQDLEFVAEQQPEVRTGDASAFSVPDPDGQEKTVMMVQCRVSNDHQRAELRVRLQRLIHHELGIECYIDLVPRNTLPRTTSGKLSRSKARKEFLKRVESGQKPLFDSTQYAALQKKKAV